MINQNCKLISVDILAHRFSIEIADPELSKLNYKYGGEVHIQISKPEREKTIQQMKTIHALLNAIFDSGMSSSPAETPTQFKLWAKMEMGVCYDWEYEGKPVRVPESVARYSKQQLSDFISRILDYIDRIGAMADRKIQEIITGMDENTKLKYG